MPAIWCCPCVAPAYGGLGGDFRYSLIVNEELAATGQTGLAASLHNDVVVPYIESFATEAQKRRFLPGCVNGDIVTAVAMTEPGAGSDLASMTTTAAAEGDWIRLDGPDSAFNTGRSRGRSSHPDAVNFSHPPIFSLWYQQNSTSIRSALSGKRSARSH